MAEDTFVHAEKGEWILRTSIGVGENVAGGQPTQERVWGSCLFA